MEGEAIFDRRGKFKTHSKMVYAVFICGGQASSVEELELAEELAGEQ